jgi:hypothetical protein
MPQLDKVTYFNQIFWFFVVFGTLLVYNKRVIIGYIIKYLNIRSFYTFYLKYKSNNIINQKKELENKARVLLKSNLQHQKLYLNKILLRSQDKLNNFKKELKF